MLPILYALPSGLTIALNALDAIRCVTHKSGNATLRLFTHGTYLDEYFDSEETMRAEFEKIKEACSPKPTNAVCEEE